MGYWGFGMGRLPAPARRPQSEGLLQYLRPYRLHMSGCVALRQDGMQRMAGGLSPTGDERGTPSPTQRSAANLEMSSPLSGDNSGRSPFKRPCAPATGPHQPALRSVKQ